jgi:hypothetical protein
MPRRKRTSSRKHEFKAPNYSLGSPDFGQSSIKYSEWTVILMRAHDDLGINPAAGVYPKHGDAREYFQRQRLSDGSLISPRSAAKLASFCRPLKAGKGGNSPNKG